jgi:hypothetical protein
MLWTFASFDKARYKLCWPWHIFDQDCSLDIFEHITSTSKLAKQLVKKMLLIFLQYQLHVRNIKCLLQWWEKHEIMFRIVYYFSLTDFGHCWIIDWKRKGFFLLARLFTNLKRCLQTENLEKLIFVNKKWP